MSRDVDQDLDTARHLDGVRWSPHPVPISTEMVEDAAAFQRAFAAGLAAARARERDPAAVLAAIASGERQPA